MKAVAAQAVAEAASAAVAEIKDLDHQQRQEGENASSSSQSHLLQLLVDIELVAEALDESSPLQQAYGPSCGVGALPQALQMAIKAGLGGARCADPLRKAAEDGRQWLQPSFAKVLK